MKVGGHDAGAALPTQLTTAKQDNQDNNMWFLAGMYDPACSEPWQGYMTQLAVNHVETMEKKPQMQQGTVH